jgi:hypothetical protein
MLTRQNAYSHVWGSRGSPVQIRPSLWFSKGSGTIWGPQAHGIQAIGQHTSDQNGLCGDLLA